MPSNQDSANTNTGLLKDQLRLALLPDLQLGRRT